jgi:hypothetical protein
MKVERWAKPVLQQILKELRATKLFDVAKSQQGVYKVTAPNGDQVLLALIGTKDYLVRYDSRYLSFEG